MDSIIDSHQEDQLTISPEIRVFLRETSKWARFLAILGFVGLGLGALGVISILSVPAFAGLDGAGTIGMGFIAFIYFLFLLLYFFPILYLYRFATNMRTALDRDDNLYLHNGFRYLKSHYRFIGILAAIMIGLYAFFLLFALIGGLMTM